MNAARIRTFAAACAFATAAFIPNVAFAASTFYGIVRHVSMNSIKVDNPRTGQTLSFEILPKFDQIFSSDGKSTYQMKAIHAGRYVGVIYDQHFLGVRHADKIYIMNNANERLRRE
jgi:hypothetical protein